MAEQKKRRARDPVSTRADILEAALTLLAKDGLEAVSLSGVAALAKVNRGTAYQHFETRESLLAAALQLVSERMFEAVFGDADVLAERDVKKVDMVETTESLARFAMENTELCRIWLMQLLAMPDPSRDPFWREYSGSIGRFAQTDLAEPGIDVDVWALISLAGQFLWPVWSRSQERGAREKEHLVERFTNEMLRLSVHGAIKPDKVPNVMARLAWSSEREDREKRQATN